MKMTAQELSIAIAEEIVRQNGEDYVDNLGDGESLLFTGTTPVVNVVQMAEAIVQAIQTKEEQT